MFSEDSNNLYSVIDIGSNTVKYMVLRYNPNETVPFCPVAKNIKKLSLINRRKDNRLQNDAVADLINTLNRFLYEINKKNCKSVYAIATASFRGLSNLDEVEDAVFKNTGLKTEVLSWQQEALFSFLSLKSFCPDINDGVMIDMGGGSSEIVSFKNKKATDFYDIDLGCANLYKKHIVNQIPTPDECEKIYREVKNCISAQKIESFMNDVYLIGGTSKAINLLIGGQFENKTVQLSPERFESLYNLVCQGLSKEEYDHLTDLVPERKDTIIPGIIAYKAIFDELNPKSIFINDCNLRQGYLIHLLEGDNQ